MLFARFLVENGVLVHPDYRAPVTLEDCAELAESLGEPDGWSVAARFAAQILPGVFRPDDPCARVRLAAEGRLALEAVIASLPSEIFHRDDSLGWVYQYWQKDRKDMINASEEKIGGADLGPVTQIFTESYMVRFLLENTLGAWWAARHPDSLLTKELKYLRSTAGDEPAAGSFTCWPSLVADVTVMDPCCGSGHFLVEAFSLLSRMRAEEEGLSQEAAQDAVLRSNLFGLELDSRCVQIAAFAVALQAWKSCGGWRQLPIINIACSGIPVKSTAQEWKELVKGDRSLESALLQLQALFKDADTLGSLIDPKRSLGRGSEQQQISFDEVAWEEVVPLLERAKERAEREELNVLGSQALGMVHAAELLARGFTLIATNVPYLARRKMGPELLAFGAQRLAGADLASLFLERMAAWADPGGAVAAVMPNKWRFQSTFRDFRRWLLHSQELAFIADLGAGAFSSTLWDFNVDLFIMNTTTPTASTHYGLVNVAGGRGPGQKSKSLQDAPLLVLSQRAQLLNPDERILTTSLELHAPPLSECAPAFQGMATGDDARFRREHWELPHIGSKWERLQSSTRRSEPYAGRSAVVDFAGVEKAGLGAIRGRDAWGKRGVGVSAMASLPVTLYGGEYYDQNITVLVPVDENDLPALWTFLASADFREAIRAIEPKLSVTTSTTAKVPFDLAHWKRIAEKSRDLPPPTSSDPTQWLFNGRPDVSSSPLHVGIARLVGFRWPDQASSDDVDPLVDSDGIVCLPSVNGEAPASERLQRLLARAFGPTWTASKFKELLVETGSKKSNLGDWLRNEFFKQHCALFGNRPFVWHIWDGEGDGFSALVNYHKLDRKSLAKLTYTYLGDWIERLKAEVHDEVPRSALRLAAALKLQESLAMIIEGEPPYDIFVRWKPPASNPIGWDPDIDDGVRVNIRPFVLAGILRSPFNIHWRRDRGKNPDGSDRLNDRHLTTAEKRAAGEEPL